MFQGSAPRMVYNLIFRFWVATFWFGFAMLCIFRFATAFGVGQLCARLALDTPTKVHGCTISEGKNHYFWEPPHINRLQGY